MSEATQAPAPAPAPDPAAAAPVAQPAPPPVAETAPQAAPVQAEGPLTAPAAEAAPAAPAAETVQPAPVAEPTSLLGEAEKTEEAPAKEPQAQQEQAPIVYQPFKLPDGGVVPAERMGKATELFAQGRLPQELAQSLVDEHVAEIARIQKEASEHQVKFWEDTQNSWKDSVRNDPEMGGSRYETTVATCRKVLNDCVKDDAERAELFQMLHVTGAGNHPAMFKLLLRVAGMMKESVPQPGTPIGQQQTRAQKRYNYAGQE